MARRTRLMFAWLALMPSVVAAQSWPTTLVFDSVDHGLACPPAEPGGPCVSGYLEEWWPQDRVGVEPPIWQLTRFLWEVTPTGSAPAYQLRLSTPPIKSLPVDVPIVFTLRALGYHFRAPSPRSAPSPEVLLLRRPSAPTLLSVR